MHFKLTIYIQSWLASSAARLNTVSPDLVFSTDYLVSVGVLKVGQKYSKYGSSIEVVEWDAEGKVEYKNYQYLLKDLREEAEVKMWTQDELKANQRALPAGGCVFIHIKGLTYESANPENWEYIFHTMDGETFKRMKGADRLPDVVATPSIAYWKNLDVVCLETLPIDAFKIYIINGIRNKRSCFIVRPNQ